MDASREVATADARKEAEAADSPTGDSTRSLFTFTDLPDAAVYQAIALCDPAGVGSMARVNVRCRDIASDARVWKGLSASTFPPDHAYFAQHPATAGMTWAERFKTAARVRDTWSGRRGGTRPPPPRMHSVSFGGAQPVFCVNHIGGGHFLASGGDGSVRVVVPEESGGGVRLAIKASQDAHDAGMLAMAVDVDAVAEGVAAGTPCKDVTVLTGSFAGEAAVWRVNWHEQSQLHALPAKRLKAILTERGVDFAGLTEKAAFVTKIKTWNALPLLTRLTRLSGHVQTIVGASLHGDVACTGGNDGVLRVWRVGRQDSSQAGLALAELQSSTTQHGIDSVHYDPRWGTVYAGDKAGAVTVWDLGAGGRQVATLETGRRGGGAQAYSWVWCVKTGSTWASSAGREPAGDVVGNEGVDWGECVLRATGRAQQQHAAGGSSSSSVFTTATRAQPPHAPPTWLYEHVAATLEGEDDDELSESEREAVRVGLAGGSGPSAGERRGSSSAPHVSTHGAEAGGTALGNGQVLLTGDTDGRVCMWDLRACGTAHNGWSGSPVAGMSPMFAHNRMVTASFDGCARVWDLRSFKPVTTLQYTASRAGGERGGPGAAAAAARLCRVDVSPDMIVAGSMEGTLVAWDMWPESRGAVSA